MFIMKEQQSASASFGLSIVPVIDALSYYLPFVGTHFVDEGATYRPPKAGTAVIFSGKNKHMGNLHVYEVNY